MSNKDFLNVDLLNIQFGVGFGAIFTFLFKVNFDDTIIPSFHLSWSELAFCLLLSYYFLDWYYANTTFKKFTKAHLIIGSFFIWILASQVILLKGRWELSNELIGIYFLFIAFFDLFGWFEAKYDLIKNFGIFYNVNIKEMSSSQEASWILQCLLKLGVGILLIIFGNNILWLYVFIIIALIIKLWRAKIVSIIINSTVSNNE